MLTHQSTTLDPLTLLREAAEHYASEHCSYPHAMIIHPLHRIGLPIDQWHVYIHDVLPIELYSYGDPEVAHIAPEPPDMHTVLCFEKDVLTKHN